MAHVRTSSTTSNSNLVEGKRVANQSSQPEIYHLFFVRVSADARCLPEDGNGLWPISASHWPISGGLVPVLPLPRTLDSAFREPSLRPSESQGARVAHTSFCDVCDLSAIVLECTGTLGTGLQGTMIAYMPKGGMYAPPAEISHSPLLLPENRKGAHTSVLMYAIYRTRSKRRPSWLRTHGL